MLAAHGEHRLHSSDEEGIVAEPRISRLRLLRERDGPLSEALEYQIVQVTVRRELYGRLDTISGKPRAATDSNRLHSGNTPSATEANVISTEAPNR